MILPAAVAACVGAVAAAAVDLRTGFIPDPLCGATAVIALTLAAVAGDLSSALLGGLVAGGSLFGLFTVTRGRGLGFGDVKLAGAIGLGLGPLDALAALGAAFVMGAAYAVPLLASRRLRRRDTIAFGPFLAAGALFAAACEGSR